MTKTIEEKAIELCKRLSCHKILEEEARSLSHEWNTDPRWSGVERPYSPEDELKLRGTLKLEYTFALAGSKRLWFLFQLLFLVFLAGALFFGVAVFLGVVFFFFGAVTFLSAF